MTQEEIKQKSIEIQCNYYDGYYSGHIESYQKTAIEAAEWAKETIIKEACEWLRKNSTIEDEGIRNFYINSFKKAMEK